MERCRFKVAGNICIGARQYKQLTINMDNSNRLYIDAGRVYLGTTALTIHNQRGRMYVKVKGRQINVKNIPRKPPEWDLFKWYVLDGLFQLNPCPVIDWWLQMRQSGKYKRPV